MQKHQIVEKRLQWNRHLSEAYTKRCFPVAKIDISSPSNSLVKFISFCHFGRI